MSGGNYLDSLNAPQREAVEYLGGPELVIAGAGSGKTRVLTYKVLHLLENGYRPGQIMALTFTNKAAEEMRSRAAQMIGDEAAAHLWMGTFHSVFARLLRRHADLLGYRSNFTIYDSSDSKSLIRSVIRDLKLDEKYYRPGDIAKQISWAKNSLFSPDDYALCRDFTNADTAANRPETWRVYQAYVQRCRVAQAMDFDDLLFNTNVLLRDNPDVLAFYREYFRYVLVDEYQDTNYAQHLIVVQLTRGHGNLCVVGDDAQSIYSFRGANIDNILQLQRDFPTLRTIKLEQNYRSTKAILNAANALIANNSRQIPKNIFTEGATGMPVSVTRTYNDYEEAYAVAGQISQLRMQQHTQYNDFAVLYRTNAQSNKLEEALRNRNIPYRVYGGLAFFQRKEIKDAVCYFRLAVNPADDEALKRVINTPARGIGDTTVGKISAAATAAGVPMMDVVAHPERFGVKINRGTAAKLAGFTVLADKFIEMANAGADASELARTIIKDTRLIDQYLTDTTPENISKQENLHELIASVDNFVSTQREQGYAENPSMTDFLAKSSLASEQDFDEGSSSGDCVTLMTIHAAKGLEFENIFVVGVEEDLLPSSRSVGNENAVQEERRLMYVAITRAKRRCMLSYAQHRILNGKTINPRPSRFLKEINAAPVQRATAEQRPQRPASLHGMPGIVDSAPKPKPVQPAPSSNAAFTKHDSSELTTGMRILHERFGKGVITHIDTTQPDHRIEVRFVEGVKTLLLKFSKFTITGQ